MIRKKLFLKVVLASALLIVASSAIYGFDWVMEQRTISETFGSNKYGNYFQGIEITSQRDRVYSSHSGEIVFYHNGGDVFSTLPSALGNYVAVEHEGGLRTIYGHLEENTIDPTVFEVSNETVVGRIGDTGYTYGRNLYFSVYDDELGQLINPLLLLPQIDDASAPIIREVSVTTEDGEEIPLSNGVNIPAGTVEVLTTIIDVNRQVDFYSPMAPFFISVYINGEEFRTIEYEAITIHEGSLALDPNNNLLYSEYYENEWRSNLGSIILNPGQSRVEIVTKDVNGNEASTMYSLYVIQ